MGGLSGGLADEELGSVDEQLKKKKNSRHQLKTSAGYSAVIHKANVSKIAGPDFHAERNIGGKITTGYHNRFLLVHSIHAPNINGGAY